MSGIRVGNESPPPIVPAIGRPPICILFCHHSADAGGGSDRSLYELVGALPRDRFCPILMLRTGDPMADLYRNEGFDVFDLPLRSPRRSRNPIHIIRFLLNGLLAAVRISRIIRRRDVDLVHVNTLTNAQAALAARLAARPLIWHVRELMPESRGYRLLAWLARRWATRIVAISGAVARAFPDCRKVQVIPNGIDLGRCRSATGPAEARTALGIDPDAPVIALLGRLEPWKGHHVLVEAAPAILARHPQCRILLLGSPAVNKSDYAQRLAYRCDALGISQSVRLLPHRDDIAPILAAATVVVSCSVSPEPFGRTLVEAMAAGRPVVATHGGGPEEIVENGVTGLLVPPGEPAPLAEAVCRLIEHPGEAAALSEAGRNRAESHYSIARLASDMAGLFQDLVHRSSSH